MILVGVGQQLKKGASVSDIGHRQSEAMRMGATTSDSYFQWPRFLLPQPSPVPGRRRLRPPHPPRLNALSFEKLTNEQIGENIRTEANIGDTVKPMDELTDSWACERHHASVDLSRSLKT